MVETWRVFGKLIVLVLVGLIIGQIGVLYATAEQYGWYHYLLKPSWVLPILFFPLIWTSMYIIMALAAWKIWQRKKSGYRLALFLWSIQLILNGLWMPLFFGYHQLLLTSLLSLFLFITVLIANIVFFRLSKFAGIILLFYLIWIIYINLFNFLIWKLN